MIGVPISVIFCVPTSTANISRGLFLFGTKTKVSPKTGSWLWSILRFLKAALMSAIESPIPTPRASAPPRIVMSVALRGLLCVKLTEPLQR